MHTWQELEHWDSRFCFLLINKFGARANILIKPPNMNIWLWHGSTLRQTYKISSKFFVVKFFLSWFICLYVCMCMLTHVCRHQQRPDKSPESPGAILQVAESLPVWVLGTNSSLLQKQLVPASLQPLAPLLKFHSIKFRSSTRHRNIIPLLESLVLYWDLIEEILLRDNVAVLTGKLQQSGGNKEGRWQTGGSR